MKKVKYILTVATSAALLTTACEKVVRPGVPDSAITFGMPSVAVSASTRSGLIEGELPDGSEFGVMGYCLGNTVGTTGLDRLDYHSGSQRWSDKESACPPSVFFNQKVTVEAEGCSYSYSGWKAAAEGFRSWYADGSDLDGSPNDRVSGADSYRYTFFAYYPYDGNISDGIGFDLLSPTEQSGFGAPEYRFTMPYSGAVQAISSSQSTVPDAMLAVLYDRTSREGNIQFRFSHLLTALGVEINNFSDFPLTVHKVTLSGDFYRSIEVSLANRNVSFTTPAGDTYNAEYVYFDDGGDNTESLTLNAVEGDFSSNSMTVGDYILLISGDGGSDGYSYFGPNPENLKMNITYTFDDKVRHTASFTRPASFTPRPGTRYTAQLNFVGDEFVLLFAVDNNEEWELGNGDDGTVVFE